MQGIDFTPLNTVANNLVALLQIIGGLMVLVSISVLGLMKITSFGSEHKNTIIKTAAIDIVLGIVILLAAPALAHILLGALAFLNTAPKPTN